MFWMFLLMLVMGFVFFKLGVYSIVLGLCQLAFKVLFIVSGAFLVYGVWRWSARWWQRRRVTFVQSW